MVNFIGPLIILTGLLSLIGIIAGLIIKNKRLLLISIFIFTLIAIIFLLESFLFE